MEGVHEEENDTDCKIVDGEVYRLSTQHFRCDVVRRPTQVGYITLIIPSPESSLSLER